MVGAGRSHRPRATAPPVVKTWGRGGGGRGGPPPYLQRTKVRDVLKWVEREGWVLVRTRGSHRQFKHGEKPGLVTLPGKPGDDLAPGTYSSILKQAGLET